MHASLSKDDDNNAPIRLQCKAWITVCHGTQVMGAVEVDSDDDRAEDDEEDSYMGAMFAE